MPVAVIKFYKGTYNNFEFFPDLTIAVSLNSNGEITLDKNNIMCY